MDSLEPIKRKIYEIRGRRVMLDFDLADAYGVKTAQLKRQVPMCTPTNLLFFCKKNRNNVYSLKN